IHFIRRRNLLLDFFDKINCLIKGLIHFPVSCYDRFSHSKPSVFKRFCSVISAKKGALHVPPSLQPTVSTDILAYKSFIYRLTPQFPVILYHPSTLMKRRRLLKYGPFSKRLRIFLPLQPSRRRR